MPASDRASMPGLSLQIDNCPVFLTLLNVGEIQVNCFMASYATRKAIRPEGHDHVFPSGARRWSLPQRLRLFGSEPVS